MGRAHRQCARTAPRTGGTLRRTHCRHLQRPEERRTRRTARRAYGHRRRKGPRDGAAASRGLRVMSAAHEEGRFNLSAWALRHQALVVFLITLATLFGIMAYTRLAQSEDPPFTFRVMVIQTFWPGATARQVQEQVTDRIGRKLQETPDVDFLRSYSRPGESLLFFTIRDAT